MKLRYLAVAVLPLAVAACSNGESASSGSSTASLGGSSGGVERWYKPEHVALGGKVYENNCATCHGDQGQGADNWRKMGTDGKYPPPPLNGTGHAWHHPLAGLFYTIKGGSPGGKGNMPAWDGKLSEQEMVSVIAWFQSHWPDEIYEAWARRDLASRQKG